MSLQSQIDLARKRAADRQAAWEREFQERTRAHEQRMVAFNRDIRPRLRRATAREYNAWLRGYLERGGSIGHVYDYGLPSSFYVAVADIENLPALFGSEAVSIIVPEGVTVAYADRGHNEVFRMAGFDHETTSGPAVYADTTID